MSDTTQVWGERMVGDVVAEDYRRAAVFQRHGIDFCCGGSRSVRSACEEVGADYEAVASSLEKVGANGTPVEDPGEWALDALADHIVERHHGYVRETLPVLRQFAGKVAKVHGGRHGELLEIRDLVEELAVEMERHMAEEETVLFPRIRVLVSGSDDGAGDDAADAVSGAVPPLEDDHDHAGALMARIRELSGGFQPPADACNTYRATYAKLEEFEADLHRHVHLENNVLFPRAVEAEARAA